jgi:hypothetical protein
LTTDELSLVYEWYYLHKVVPPNLLYRETDRDTGFRRMEVDEDDCFLDLAVGEQVEYGIHSNFVFECPDGWINENFRAIKTRIIYSRIDKDSRAIKCRYRRSGDGKLRFHKIVDKTVENQSWDDVQSISVPAKCKSLPAIIDLPEEKINTHTSVNLPFHKMADGSKGRLNALKKRKSSNIRHEVNSLDMGTISCALASKNLELYRTYLILKRYGNSMGLLSATMNELQKVTGLGRKKIKGSLEKLAVLGGVKLLPVSGKRLRIVFVSNKVNFFPIPDTLDCDGRKLGSNNRKMVIDDAYKVSDIVDDKLKFEQTSLLASTLYHKIRSVGRNNMMAESLLKNLDLNFNNLPPSVKKAVVRYSNSVKGELRVGYKKELTKASRAILSDSNIKEYLITTTDSKDRKCDIRSKIGHEPITLTASRRFMSTITGYSIARIQQIVSEKGGIFNKSFSTCGSSGIKGDGKLIKIQHQYEEFDGEGCGDTEIDVMNDSLWEDYSSGRLSAHSYGFISPRDDGTLMKVNSSNIHIPSSLIRIKNASRTTRYRKGSNIDPNSPCGKIRMEQAEKAARTQPIRDLFDLSVPSHPLTNF